MPMIMENGAMVLDATLVDRRETTCDLVAPVVPIAVPVASETHDEEMGDSRIVSECEAPQIPVPLRILRCSCGLGRPCHA